MCISVHEGGREAPNQCSKRRKNEPVIIHNSVQNLPPKYQTQIIPALPVLFTGPRVLTVDSGFGVNVKSRAMSLEKGAYVSQ